MGRKSQRGWTKSRLYDVRDQGEKRELILLTTFREMSLGTIIIIILISQSPLATGNTILSDKTGLPVLTILPNFNGVSTRFYDSGN